jgi:hypothetical protein
LVVLIDFCCWILALTPLSEEEILEFYDRSQVPVEIRQISLDHFRAKLIKVLK